jgi:exonuclease SbcC
VITDLIIEGYQALRNEAKLRLGMFTVITGPTGSGKSSVIRAARLVAFNARGTSYISQGSKKAVACIGSQNEGWAIAITRGSRGADSYRLARHYLIEDREPKVTEFTKLAGKVPDQVSEVINLSPLNFAGQWDSPFLLTASPGEIARVLGNLTQVTTIFKAAAEAQTRKKRLMADLKATETELDRLREEAKRFTTLQQRRDAAQAAEEALARLAGHQAQAQRLEAAMGRLSAAQHALDIFVLPPEPPSLSMLEEKAGQIARLQGLIDAHENARMNRDKAQEEKAGAIIEVADAEQRHHQALVAAGQCPTCGQPVS